MKMSIPSQGLHGWSETGLQAFTLVNMNDVDLPDYEIRQ